MHPLLLSLVLLQPPESLATRLHLVAQNSSDAQVEVVQPYSRATTLLLGGLEAGVGTGLVYLGGLGTFVGLQVGGRALSIPSVSGTSDTGLIFEGVAGLSILPVLAALGATLVAYVAGRPPRFLQALLGALSGAAAGYLLTAGAVVAEGLFLTSQGGRRSEATAGLLAISGLFGLLVGTPVLTGLGAGIGLNVTSPWSAAATPVPAAQPVLEQPPQAVMFGLPVLRFD